MCSGWTVRQVASGVFFGGAHGLLKRAAEIAQRRHVRDGARVRQHSS